MHSKPIDALKANPVKVEEKAALQILRVSQYREGSIEFVLSQVEDATLSPPQ